MFLHCNFGPSLGRVGIYIRKSSRSLAENRSEHFHGVDTFSNKSHMIKHWMISHGEMETMPPFKIKILKQYMDCLSRQVWDAIQILMSKDQLLNSKNEYIQNCLARITVQEDLNERKARTLKEEEEEKRLEMDFKSRKKNSKRKPEEENHFLDYITLFVLNI